MLVVGPSGGGKSTVLAGIAGLLGAADDGEELGALTLGGQSARARALPVGLVRQDPETQVLLQRVGDEVCFAPENMGLSAAETASRALEALEHVGLELPTQHPTAQLSGGQKQRLAVASMLAARPDVWVLDEPTAQLDPASSVRVVNAVISALRERDTMIVVDHDVELWWPHLTRVLAIDSTGELVWDGTPAQALSAAAHILSELGVWLPGQASPLMRARQPETLSSTVPLLSMRRTQVGYGSVAAQPPLDFTVHAGHSTVVAGPNGSGKTAFALTLGGLLSPVAGRVHASTDFSPHRRSRVIEEPIEWSSRELSDRIASVFQQPDLQFITSRVRDEVATAASSVQAADDFLERFGLSRYAHAHPMSLSGGEKRRLSVATALVSRADVIIADEPTFGQDAHTWRMLVTALDEAQQSGRALVLPSHDYRLAPALGAEVLTLAESAGP